MNLGRKQITKKFIEKNIELEISKQETNSQEKYLIKINK